MAKLLFQFIFIAVTTFSVSGFCKTCVLSILEKESPASQKVSSIFKFDHQFDLFQEPSLSQIKSCFASNIYQEVIWISHGTLLQGGLPVKSSPIFIYRDSQGHVQKAMIPNRFFEVLSQLSQTNNYLKKVRVNVCGLSENPEKIQEQSYYRSTIEILLQNLLKNHIAVDVSDKSILGTYVVGEPVTAISENWLSESLNWNERSLYKKWRTEGNQNCEYDSWPGCDRQTAQMVIPTAKY